MAELTVAAYRQAYRQLLIADSKRGFKIHLLVYVVMNTILVSINLLTNPESLWCLSALLGWGSGIVAHFITAVVLIGKKLAGMEQEAERRAATG